MRLAVNPRARRLTLRLDVARGEVVAVAPSAGRLGEAAAFARLRSGWIAAQLERRPAPLPFRPGAVVPVRGRACRLVARPGRAAARLVEPDAIESGGEGEAFARRVQALLRREALADLGARTAVHAAALGLVAPRVSLGDARGRWGSCTPSRSAVRFSWRLIAAPPEVLDYVAAHECAHLVEPNHSPAFWAQVALLVGDAGPARAWLKAHGPALHALGREPSPGLADRDG